MTDELDALDPLTQPDQAGLLARATAWRTRIVTYPNPTTFPTEFLTAPDTNILHLALPPECRQLGELARTLAPPSRSVAAHTAPGDSPTLAHLCHGDLHPTQGLLNLYALLYHHQGESAPLPSPTHLAPLDKLLPATPTADNPAKQLAFALQERIPLIWGSEAAAWIARDWMVRQLWYAERQAWSASTAEMAKLHVMARFPRYLPNSVAWVELTLSASQTAPQTAPDERIAADLRHIAQRRRLPHHTVSIPAGLTRLEAVVYLLEFGEWTALYAALLNNVDPGERVPHQILF
jgi:hypothetical protein